MRKRIIDEPLQSAPDGRAWLDLTAIATVEVSSEDPAYAIEGALLSNAEGRRGWRAAKPGPQVVRLLFDERVRLRRIHLRFQDGDQPRTQEFTVGAWDSDTQQLRELIRQQFAFSAETRSETEDYEVDLVTDRLELNIIPDISHGDAIASLEMLRLASEGPAFTDV